MEFESLSKILYELKVYQIKGHMDYITNKPAMLMMWWPGG